MWFDQAVYQTSITTEKDDKTVVLSMVVQSQKTDEAP